MGLLDFQSNYKILFANHLKHSSFGPLADAKPISNVLVHALPSQFLFALSMCTLISLCLHHEQPGMLCQPCLPYQPCRAAQWKGSNRKQSARWQQVYRLKATAFCIW
jgi:hypothetical protein